MQVQVLSLAPSFGNKKDIAGKNLGFTEVFAIYTGKSGTFLRVKFLTNEVHFHRYFLAFF